MAITPSASRIFQAISALNAFDRDAAVALLKDEFSNTPPTGERWRSVSMLTAQIGETAMALEAAKRFADSEPRTLERILYYAKELMQYDRTAQTKQLLDALPQAAKDHPATLHLYGMIATQTGDFDAAQALFRRVLAQTEMVPQTWFALSVIKKFVPGDADLAAMERVRTSMHQAPPDMEAQFLYALGKAYDDVGAYDRAFAAYEQGAKRMRGLTPFDAFAIDAFADALIRDYTPTTMKQLTPSGCDGERSIFVTGLPRSGTTLVEQILTAHSTVAAGAELNLLRAALIPAGDYSFAGAMAYQTRVGGADPWGQLGRDYLAMLDQRAGSNGRIVDKTLNHSRFMGLLLHTLPKAKIVWVRRNPDDCALSCFRTFFPSPMPWSWSLGDIAAYFRSEDRLFAHWHAHFPDRILCVSYEDLVQDPRAGISKILAHVGLQAEEQVFEPHKNKRSVTTASVAQVRAPITRARVGAAVAYRDAFKPFRDAYYR